MMDLPGQLSLFGDAPADAGTAAQSSALPDAAQRARIARDLETNLLVEAGAGAGKTTEMVGRMLALVASGVDVERIAAVTFTRKAAAELRERFQTKVEQRLREALAPETAARLERALRDIDRAFIGTIHSFCARLLRERPLDAGIDPAFRELQAAEQRQIQTAFWYAHLDRLAADGDPQLVELTRIGLKPQQLYELFEVLVEQPDVEFPLADVPAPAAAPARTALERWHDHAQTLMPASEPEKGWDELQNVVRRLRYHRFVVGWRDDVDLLSTLGELPRKAEATQYKWALDGGKRAPDAKRLGEDYCALFDDTGIVGQTVRLWRAHRYPIAMRFAMRAAEAFAEHRQREGMLTFQDLLMLAARLLRERPTARRELSERYRYLLVDEFQDTDPVQAEVVFLLAAGSNADAEPDWTRVAPRAGSLFVVGDPKQSIYRFRRADIGIYNHAKARLTESGDVLQLTSNFRSGPRIAEFVNAVFGAALPAESTALQAAFAPLEAQKADDPSGGVFWYALDDGGQSSRAYMEALDPDLVATWMSERIARGERAAGDFLLLGRQNKFLGAYATALEARGIPVQVSGGGVTMQEEVDELVVLLRALEDPGDATLTLAALVGLFFGLDYEQLAAFVLGPHGNERAQRRSLQFVHTTEEAGLETDDERAVANALKQLHAWWQLVQEQPADVAVGRIIDDIGLLPHAAAGQLGETRAGAVLFLLDTLRAAAGRGDASLGAALIAIETAFADDEGEAPLRPGRADVVRIMTLHKAKGLEAPVVMLVAPFGEWNPPISRHIARGEDGKARGWLRIVERQSYRDNVIAQPLEWETLQTTEEQFEAAEDVRLLYVATTRAKDELVIAVPAESKRKASPWAALHAPVMQIGTSIPMARRAPAPRAVLARSAADIVAESEHVNAARQARSVASYRAAPVKQRAGEVTDYEEQVKLEAREARRSAPTDAGRGAEWGSVVHGALQAAGRGVRGAALRETCRALLITHERPLDASGDPVELAELETLVRAVLGSGLWLRCNAASERLVEVPLAMAIPLAEYRRMTNSERETSSLQLLEGVIDLAFREPDGWIVADYKTDAKGARIDAPRLAKYRAQVDLYAAALERITGESVKERVLLFTADGATHEW